MSEEFFKRALKNFSQDMANGGAIRHLWNLGYSVSQIMESLDYPAPYERVQNVVWDHLVDTGVICLTKPERAHRQEQVSYVKEYDKYGRTSFRRVTEVKDPGEMDIYLPCDFGLVMGRERELYEKILDCLKERQREYITDIPWKNMRIYHKKDKMMEGIVENLQTVGLSTAFGQYDDKPFFS
ncbi:MAG: hypothetical protein NC307_03025 [Roseburia sp.]|nr:hypothetical protein [Roseburia sp.]